jgi:Protein of unknown function (DUF4232)
MTAPSDPDETHGDSGASNDPGDDVFGDDSGTWNADDQLFDLMLRERIGQVPHLPTPPHAFERVLVKGRRHRARKVWAAGAAAALVIVGGTAGTTVVLHNNSANGSALPPAVAVSQATTPVPSTGAPSASALPGPKGTSTSTSSTSTAAGTATVQASTTQCHSDALQLTVSVEDGGDNLANLLIVLRNKSAQTCTITGYAANLQPETESGQLQNTTLIQQEQTAVQKLTLTQGQSVSTISEFNFGAPGATTSQGMKCDPPAYSFAVTPPGEQSPLVAPITGGPVTFCGNGVMDSLPFTSGTTG